MPRALTLAAVRAEFSVTTRFLPDLYAVKNPPRQRPGTPSRSVILLARLAVDLQEQGTGLGRILLVDAFSRALAAAESIGALALLVHAIDDWAATFYGKYSFEPLALDSRQLLLLMKRPPRDGGLDWLELNHLDF